MVYFRLRFYLIDRWELSDHFIVEFDGRPFPQTVGNQRSKFRADVCGDATKPDSTYYVIRGRILHTANTITVRVISKISKPPDQANFGLRKVVLTFVNNTIGHSEG